jgi:hypothetical protein
MTTTAMKFLPLPDQRFLNAAEGWLGLGDYLQANEELENITSKLRHHPYVLEIRWRVYSMAKQWEVARALSEMLPQDPFGYIHYAYSLHELGRTREAWGVQIPVGHLIRGGTNFVTFHVRSFSIVLKQRGYSVQWLLNESPWGMANSIIKLESRDF